MNLNSRTHEQINQSDLHKTPVKPILKCLNSEQYPLLGIFASWVRRLPPIFPSAESAISVAGYYSHRSEFKEKTESWRCNSHFLPGCYRIRNDAGQRGKTGDEFSTLWKTILRFFHAMEDPAHAGPHCGKRGSRSVDLPVRASSSSVARLLLLDREHLQESRPFSRFS